MESKTFPFLKRFETFELERRMRERCVTFQSACTNYILNVAIAYRLEQGLFRAQGWLNLGSERTLEVSICSIFDSERRN